MDCVLVFGQEGGCTNELQTRSRMTMNRYSPWEVASLREIQKASYTAGEGTALSRAARHAYATSGGVKIAMLLEMRCHIPASQVLFLRVKVFAGNISAWAGPKIRLDKDLPVSIPASPAAWRGDLSVTCPSEGLVRHKGQYPKEDKKSTNNCFILKPFNDQNMMEI
ncbi:hypothetical protein An15g07780 [Aspergillus niger]|uniref:Uncharacterized protein n=2 Tax=Aspergillus niger TaxID=5061 RepID=A2R6F7_ASPNC|nr:hypothetical protein An15g07780 [Aspergillus niger]CAK42665.1 hypothetical protein An15g07780 [Aspergillus niger]